MKQLLVILIIGLQFILTGCNGQLSIPQLQQPTITPEITATAVSPTSTPPVNDFSPTPAGPATLKLWLPPEFYPTPGNAAGELLQSRVEEFMQLHPEVRIELREKAMEGLGGMLDSLTTASAAAPLALPDLVAFPNSVMEIAALKGLLVAQTDFELDLKDDDWYEYARQLPNIQDKIYGLPFAGDAQLVVYRSSLLETAPISWSEVLTATLPLVFPAADPQALFTLIQYQSLDGQLYDDEGRPFLDTELLTQILTFYQSAEQSGKIPYWSTRYENDEEVWQAYNDQAADVAVIWASNYLKNIPESSLLSPIPTLNGMPYTYASGWVWSVTSPDPIKQALSVELAEFLSQKEFLAQWIVTTGYLPVRQSSILQWQNEENKAVLDKILSSAVVIPSLDTLTILGSPIKQAVVDILKQQSDPKSAAQKAADSLTSP